MQDLNDKINNGGATADGQISATEWNQVPTEIQNVIESLGQTLSGADLNQLGKAIAGYAANGAFYTDSGAADAYVLTPVGTGKQAPPAYTDGMQVEFLATNTNTTSSTVNVGGLGVKAIDETTIAGTIQSGQRYQLRYKTSSGTFEIVNRETIVLIAKASASSSATIDFTSIRETEFSRYILRGRNIVPGTNGVNLLFRSSYSSVFSAGAADYAYQVLRIVWTGTGSGGSTGASEFDLCNGESLGNAANQYVDFDMEINNGPRLQAFWQTQGLMASASYINCICGGKQLANLSADGFRILLSSGLIATGDFYLYGVRS